MVSKKASENVTNSNGDSPITCPYAQTPWVHNEHVRVSNYISIVGGRTLWLKLRVKKSVRTLDNHATERKALNNPFHNDEEIITPHQVEVEED